MFRKLLWIVMIVFVCFVYGSFHVCDASAYRTEAKGAHRFQWRDEEYLKLAGDATRNNGIVIVVQNCTVDEVDCLIPWWVYASGTRSVTFCSRDVKVPAYSVLEVPGRSRGAAEAGYFAAGEKYDDNTLGFIKVGNAKIRISGYGYKETRTCDDIYWNFDCDSCKTFSAHKKDGTHCTYRLNNGKTVDFYISGRDVANTLKTENGDGEHYRYLTSLYITVTKTIPYGAFDDPDC